MYELLVALSDDRKRDPLVGRQLLREDIEAFIEKFFPGNSRSPVVETSLNFLFNEAELNGSLGDELDRVYLAHMNEIKNAVQRPNAAAVPSAILESGQQEDCLISAIDKWSPLKLINYLALQAVQASDKRAIVATARDEGLSILEWIAYHRSIGFDAFFIYTNDNTDGSLELLETLARNQVITLIKNDVSPKVSPQQKCYEHSLYLLPQLRNYRWVSYLDIDEFFLPLNTNPLSLDGVFKRISEERQGAPVSSVFFNWRWFGSGLTFEMEDRFVLERFSETRTDHHGKSLSRLSDIVSMRPVHYPTLLPGCELLDSELRPIGDISVMHPVYGIGQVNHYWNKSFEEFALKKVRGLPSLGVAGKQRDFEQFFAWDARAGKAAIEVVPGEVLRAMRHEYDALLDLPGIAEHLANIKRSVEGKLLELERQFDLRALFEKMRSMFNQS